MAGSVSILNGSTFALSDERGDVDAGVVPEHGFFADDTRFLSHWKLVVNGHAPELISVAQPDQFSAQFFLSIDRPSVYAAPNASLVRARVTDERWLEELTVMNHTAEPFAIELRLEARADFADLFEVKDGADRTRAIDVACGDRGLVMTYRRGAFERRTTIRVDRAPDVIAGTTMTFRVLVAPRDVFVLNVEITPRARQPGRDLAARPIGTSFRRVRQHLHRELSEWLADVPLLETDWDPLQDAYRRSITDLGALRFAPSGNGDTLPAAGLPWFMTLFGRDSLLTSYQALPFLPQLARSTLRVLAERQSDRRDDFRDAEPGKILHEIRHGERTVFGEVPFSPYYGSVDATPLFLVLLDEYERWTGDRDLVRDLEPAARAALDWISLHGDTNDDGFVDYRARNTATGLVNQCWKDSWNSIVFADGRLAAPPIATCEVQGYVYDAQQRCARLADEVWGDPSLAARLRADAATLRAAFHERFVSDDLARVALALDGDGARVDSRTSNPGHLLWSGLLDAGIGAQVAADLLGDPLFSGWGVRTMADDEVAYNPLEYHNGTVWPHDNSIIVAGLARYGHREDANTIAIALLRAAASFGGRLPEVFAGYPAANTGVPVEYPTSSRPQAWAAGSTLLLLRSMLGLQAQDGELVCDPVIPPEIGHVHLLGMRGGWGVRDVVADGDPALARYRGALNAGTIA